jgi:hypothetical protein
MGEPQARPSRHGPAVDPHSAKTPYIPWAPGASSARMAASDPQAYDAALREQIRTGLSGQHRAASFAPEPTGARPVVRLDGAEAYAPSSERGVRSSGEREARRAEDSKSVRRREGRMPLPYVIASAFFLAIAVVGFGIWLAFAVISI